MICSDKLCILSQCLSLKCGHPHAAIPIESVALLTPRTMLRPLEEWSLAYHEGLLPVCYTSSDESHLIRNATRVGSNANHGSRDVSCMSPGTSYRPNFGETGYKSRR